MNDEDPEHDDVDRQEPTDPSWGRFCRHDPHHSSYYEMRRAKKAGI